MRSLIDLLRACALAIAAIAVASCGGGGSGDGGVTPDHAPAISNLRYSPSSSIQSSGGTAPVGVLVDFSDAGGDVVSARLTSSSGADLTVPISNQAGVGNGTTSVTFPVPVDTAGRYVLETWLVDSRGGASNHLSGTFEVLARDVTPHPPVISNLHYSPATAIQSAGGTAQVVATVDFADTAGDVASLRLTSTAGADMTVPLPAMSGVTRGTASATVVVAVDTVGKYAFDVWLVDGKGAASNHLTGGFEVLAQAPVRDPPAISNLRYSPTSAFQVAGGTAAIDLSVDFSDAGANVTSVRMLTSAGADLTVPVTSGGGMKSGVAAAKFVVSTASLGRFTFSVWLLDGKGDSSNGLSGAFEVLPVAGTGTWTKVAATPPAELLGVGWNGRLYAAVGRSGTAMTSTDLASWTVQSTGVTHTLRSVALSASGIVAVGDNPAGESVVLASTDGRTWLKTYQSTTDCAGGACPSVSQLSKVIWTGTQFVAVGMEQLAGAKMFHALVLTSPDGAAWTKRAAQAIPLSDEYYGPQTRYLTSIAWSGSRFVMSAVDVNWDPLVWTSTDLLAWSESRDFTNDVVWAMPFVDLAWGSGRFVALDGSGASGGAPVFASVDGLHWGVDLNTADLPEMRAVAAKDGEFLAVGDSYKETSTDGSTWTVSSHLTGCGNGVVWDGSRYVSVGTSICRSQ